MHDADTARGPLAGVTIVDLTRVLAGPFATMVLHDLGARVIKVERAGTGDDARGFGPFVGERSAYFTSLNCGKESIALDLEDASERDLLERLLARADVVVENFRPGTMDKLGFGWEALHVRHPRLIYAAVSGFGRTGPYAPRPAYDMVVQGMGGVMSITGEDGGEPTRVGVSVGDITAGLFLATGVNAALFHRQLTGEGMLVDVGMLDCQVAILENAIARYTAMGEVPRPIGARHPSITPFAALRTADGEVIVAAGNDKLFATLCEVVGRADLAVDPRFLTNPDRCTHVHALHEELERALAARTTAEWLAVLEAAGIPSGPLNDVEAVVNDPHVQARNMIVEIDDPRVAPLRAAGNPVKLSAFPELTVRPPAPDLDADRARLLEELGLTD
ncbi:MAG: CoA transferase [Acidimicrobiia bacterium]|jgi:CoA:oxalate CoA-transferase